MSAGGAAARARHLGRPLLHYRVCESTNEVARSLAERGAPHGTTVTAREQTAGRGRQGRSWTAPPGSALLCSTIVRPVLAHHRLAPLATALAVGETCEQLAQVEARIKWPNDVWIDGRKVAGILVEARSDQTAEHSWIVIGVGLNTSVSLDQMPAELRDTAATLSLPAGVDALTPLLARLEYWLDAPAENVIAAWRTRDALLGREIGWANGRGVAAGVDEQGNLVMQLPDGSQTTLAAGEVHLSVDS